MTLLRSEQPARLDGGYWELQFPMLESQPLGRLATTPAGVVVSDSVRSRCGFPYTVTLILLPDAYRHQHQEGFSRVAVLPTPVKAAMRRPLSDNLYLSPPGSALARFSIVAALHAVRPNQPHGHCHTSSYPRSPRRWKVSEASFPSVFRSEG